MAPKLANTCTYNHTRYRHLLMHAKPHPTAHQQLPKLRVLRPGPRTLNTLDQHCLFKSSWKLPLFAYLRESSIAGWVGGQTQAILGILL